MTSLTQGGTGSICEIDEPIQAEDVTYDNTTSGLTADNVQAAIDELEEEIDNIPQVQADGNTITDTAGTFSVTNPLPSGGKDGQPLVKSGLNTPLYRQGCFRYSASGVFWDIIDVDNMTRETPSSYVASSGDASVANAFDDNLSTRWFSDVGAQDAYIDINFSSAVTISVLGLFFGSSSKPKFIEVSDANTGQMLAYFETIRNAEHRYDTTTQGNIDYYTICSLKSTDKIRIRFYEDWFTTNRVSCSVIQLFSGDIAYKPNAFFGNNGFFSLLSQTEASTAQLSSNFRPVSNAGHSQRVNTFGTRTLQATDIDSYQRMASTATYTLPQDADLWGKALHCATQSNNTGIVKVASGRNGLINGEMVTNLNYTIPQYTSVKLVYLNNSATSDWEFIPSVPEMLYCGAGRKSTNARKLDDYYELDASPLLAT